MVVTDKSGVTDTLYSSGLTDSRVCSRDTICGHLSLGRERQEYEHGWLYLQKAWNMTNTYYRRTGSGDRNEKDTKIKGKQDIDSRGNQILTISDPGQRKLDSYFMNNGNEKGTQ